MCVFICACVQRLNVDSKGSYRCACAGRCWVAASETDLSVIRAASCSFVSVRLSQWSYRLTFCTSHCFCTSAAESWLLYVIHLLSLCVARKNETW